MTIVRKYFCPAGLFVLLLFLIGCPSSWKDRSSRIGLDIKVCSDAMMVRTRLGNYLTGYLAEEMSSTRTRVIFIAMELTKFEINERLTVSGSYTDDSVRVAYGDRLPANYGVFTVQRASPPKMEKASDSYRPDNELNEI